MSYFEKLTRENWGFPWHLFLAGNLASLFFIVGLLIFLYLGILINFEQVIKLAVFSWFGVNAVGISYEAYQKATEGNPRKDFFQDMAANNIGAITILILFSIGISAVL